MRKRLYIVGFFVVIMISACNKKPKLNYSKDKLIEVTMDLYVAAEALKRIDEERGDSLRELYNSQIEEIHGVQIPLYESDIQLLKEDVEGYVKFHKKIRDTLQVMNDAIKRERKDIKTKTEKKAK